MAGAQAPVSSEAVNVSLQVAAQIEAEAAAEEAAPQARCAEAEPSEGQAGRNLRSRPRGGRLAGNAAVASE
eukprot:7044446-Pyramimonas_sp.AAC.1